MNELKLFAVYLGGNAKGCHTEVHDMVFVVGFTIEETYSQMIQAWFGDKKKVHVDAWMELDVVDGHQIRLTKKQPVNTSHLYFVNLGAYLPGQFTEVHENFFLVGESEALAKKKAKQKASKGLQTVHKDHVHNIDDCISIDHVHGFWIQLKPTTKSDNLHPVIGYQKLPTKKILSATEQTLLM